jgi:hypothetical protein
MKTFQRKTKILKKSLREENEKEPKEQEKVPAFEFDEEFKLEKTPEQLSIGIKEAEKKLKPVTVKKTPPPEKRKLTPSIIQPEPAPKKQKQETKQISPKLKKENSQPSSLDVFDFDMPTPKPKKATKKDNSFFEDFSLENQVFSKEEVNHDETNDDNDGIIRIIQRVNRKKSNSIMKAKEKKKLNQPISNESGKEILQRDNIVYYLDGLQNNQEMEEKCSSMSNLAKFFSSHDPNVFLRAHGLLKSVVTSLTECYCEKNEVFLKLLTFSF